MIILDGKHINEFGFDTEAGYEDPITPIFENKTISIPGRPGLWDFGSEIKERQISFNLLILNRYHDRMQASYNKLVAFLFDEYGKPREIKLVREYEPDKFLIVKVIQQILPQRLAEEGSFSLPLVAYDPYKYSKVTADEVTWGSEDITFEADYLLGHENDFADEYVKITGNDTLVTTVSGIAIKPIFMINGTANNLTVSANGHSFSLPNFSNTNWEINFEKYLVRRNGQETMLDMNDFYLMPGSNEINITGSNINIEMAIKYHDKYN